MNNDSKNELTIQPQKPNYLKPAFDLVPIELQNLPSWVLWKAEYKPDEKKPWAKVLKVVGGKWNARTNKPDSWSTFELAKQEYASGLYDGVGLIVIGDYIGVDLDNCRNPENGFIDIWAAWIILYLNSYTEISPSGKGIRIFCRAIKQTKRNKLTTGDDGPVFEIYDRKSWRFMTVSGAWLEGTPTVPQDRQQEIDALCAMMFPPQAPKTPVDRIGGDYSPEVDEVLAVVRRAANADKAMTLWDRTWVATGGYGGDESAADLALASTFAPYVPDVDHLDKQFRESPHYLAKDEYHLQKWERDDYRLATLQKAIDSREFIYQWTTENAIAQQIAEAEASSICTGGVMPTVDTVTVVPAADDMQELYKAAQTPEAKKTADKNKKAKAKKLSPVAALLEMAGEAGMVLFNGDGNCYATIPIAGHKENWLIDSSRFTNWISEMWFNRKGNVPTDQTIKQFQRICTINCHKLPTENVYIRMARLGSKVYWDLVNQAWECVEIDSSGWRIIANPPVKFIRGSDMAALPYPTRNGSFNDIGKFINAGDDALELLKGFLVDCLKGRHPYFVLCITGPSGSAKTSGCEKIKYLVDPSIKAGLASVPKSEQDFGVSAANGFLLGFDNISKITPAVSDWFCRAATGAGIKTRKLYSDSEQIVLRLANPVILNGIPDIVTAQDLISRSLIVELEPPVDGHWEKHIVDQLVDDLRPGIMGALCDSVAVGLANESLVIERLPRQADSVLWICKALGIGWNRLYHANRTETSSLALEGRPVAKMIKHFMAKRDTWTGSTDQLYTWLQKAKAAEVIDAKSDCVAGWLPDNLTAFGKLIKQDAPAMKECWGIDVSSKHTKNGTIISITKQQS